MLARVYTLTHFGARFDCLANLFVLRSSVAANISSNWRRDSMRKPALLLVGFIALASIGIAQENGPYKVLKRSRVGGEGGWDYIYADSAGRRLYIPRRGSQAAPATDARPAAPAVPTRLCIYNL